ncbi:hypothetical protein [Saccharicrinis fermentans]|nr:hypothetical protein [Saccharicrinis fermentans]
MKGKNNIGNKNKSLFWFSLDNAAKIFPAIRTQEHTTVLRCTAVLHHRIAIRYLLEAVSLAEKRFPYYQVSLHHGIFWYYLEETKRPFTLAPDTGLPCQAFNKHDTNAHLLRILVYKNRLSIECSHILTDGYGASQFLIWILDTYHSLKHSDTIDKTKLGLDKQLLEAETEDAYSRYFKDNIPFAARLSKSFHLPYKLNKKPRFDVLVAILNMQEIKHKSAQKGVSITEYLIAVQLFALQQIATHKNTSKKRVIRIQVPINLRNIYPSKTMRNFSLFVMPEIDTRLGIYSFDEILKIVYHKMRLETDEKLISKIISRNVGGEKKMLVRGIPLILKNLFLRYKYYTEGAYQYCSVISNLGKIKVPDKLKDKIDYFVITPPPPNKKLKINCGVAGFHDKLVLSFGNITRSKELERYFLSFLTKEGMHVQIKKLSDL